MWSINKEVDKQVMPARTLLALLENSIIGFPMHADDNDLCTKINLLCYNMPQISTGIVAGSGVFYTNPEIQFTVDDVTINDSFEDFGLETTSSYISSNPMVGQGHVGT